MLILIFAVCSLLLGLPLNAATWAHEYGEWRGGAPAAADRHFPKSGLFHLYLGVNMATSDYTEPDIGVKHSGFYFPGLVVKLALEDPDRLPFFASLRYKYQQGTYNYDGYLQDLAGRRITYSDTALPVSKYDVELLVGAIRGRFRAFTGIQYESYTDKGFTTNPHFYQRTRESVYGILGFGAKHTWEPYRSAELVVKAKPLLSGSHSSRMSDLGGVWTQAGTIKKDQSKGFRAEISVEYQYEMLWIEPYFSYTRLAATDSARFSIANGALTGQIKEPLNTTAEFGINIGIRF
jgi:hypothetical protein